VTGPRTVGRRIPGLVPRAGASCQTHQSTSAPDLPAGKSGEFRSWEADLIRAHHLVGRSPEPSSCGHAAGYDVPGLVTNVASLRRATRSEAPKHLGEMGTPPRSQVRPARSTPPVAGAVSHPARPPDGHRACFRELLIATLPRPPTRSSRCLKARASRRIRVKCPFGHLDGSRGAALPKKCRNEAPQMQTSWNDSKGHNGARPARRAARTMGHGL